MRDLITDLFQFDRLDELAKKNNLSSIEWAACIARINYVLLAQGDISVDNVIIDQDGNVTWGARQIKYVLDDGVTVDWIKTKLDGIAHCFGAMANHLTKEEELVSVFPMVQTLISDVIKEVSGAAATVQKAEYGASGDIGAAIFGALGKNPSLLPALISAGVL